MLMPLLSEIVVVKYVFEANGRPLCVKEENVSRSKQLLERPSSFKPAAFAKQPLGCHVAQVGVAEFSLPYQVYIELIAPDSFALDSLLMQ